MKINEIKLFSAIKYNFYFSLIFMQNSFINFRCLFNFTYGYGDIRTHRAA
jgi:hypothetical protein